MASAQTVTPEPTIPAVPEVPLSEDDPIEYTFDKVGYRRHHALHTRWIEYPGGRGQLTTWYSDGRVIVREVQITAVNSGRWPVPPTPEATPTP